MGLHNKDIKGAALRRSAPICLKVTIYLMLRCTKFTLGMQTRQWVQWEENNSVLLIGDDACGCVDDELLLEEDFWSSVDMSRKKMCEEALLCKMHEAPLFWLVYIQGVCEAPVDKLESKWCVCSPSALVSWRRCIPSSRCWRRGRRLAP